MKQTEIMMDMPVTIEIVSDNVLQKTFDEIFQFFKNVDDRFSFFKDDSEVAGLNNGRLKKNELSKDLQNILDLCEKTRIETNGYFNCIRPDGKCDPSGITKGWAILKASQILDKKGFKNYCIEVAGDIQTCGKNDEGLNWRVGIRNPFNIKEVVKVLEVKNNGVATSGSYVRENHIYNPKDSTDLLNEIVSISIVGKNVLDADRFATSAFAMGKAGINFIEKLPDFEAYMIDKNGIATMTSGLNRFIVN